jgi:alpha-beta hydrolase superfamily lysophospholipase
MKQVITVCDRQDTTCNGQVSSFRLWHEGDRTASTVDLCEAHAAPILALIAGADAVELPNKPRAAMQITKLRATEATRHLKK